MSDWKVLARFVAACLPVGLVSRARGSVTAGPRPNQSAAGAWDTVFRELAPSLSRPI